MEYTVLARIEKDEDRFWYCIGLPPPSPFSYFCPKLVHPPSPKHILQNPTILNILIGEFKEC